MGKKVIRVLVSNGNAIEPVVLDHIVFEVTMTHAPAEKEAYLRVIVDATPFNQCSRAPRAGMDSETRVAV